MNRKVHHGNHVYVGSLSLTRAMSAVAASQSSKAQAQPASHEASVMRSDEAVLVSACCKPGGSSFLVLRDGNVASIFITHHQEP